MFPRMLLIFSSLLAFAGSGKDIKGIDVLVLSLNSDSLAHAQIQTKDQVWLEVVYRAGKNAAILHEEWGERLWWIADQPLVVLGGSGLQLPPSLLERAAVWVEVHHGGTLVWEGELFPRKDALRLTQDSDQVAQQLSKGGNLRFTASYLSEVANFMAANSAAVEVDADSYELNSARIIDNRGINIDGTNATGGWGTVAGNFFRFSGQQGATRGGGLDEPSRWFALNLGAYSTAFGFNNIARGAYSVSMGLSTETYGQHSVAFGSGTRVDGNFSFAGGEDSEADGDHAFSYGNSTFADGNNSVAMGSAARAIGSNSISLGSSTTAHSSASFAAGSATNARGITSVAMGFNTDAFGAQSFAMGNFSNANGDYSVAFGNSTNASYGATSIGRYNLDQGSSSSWVSTDPLFTIGNGTTGLARRNAFEIAKDGFMQVRRDVDAAGTNPTHYVASIVNEEPTQGGDVLALSVQPANPDASSNFITFFGNGTAVGAIDGNGSGGVAYKSGSADLAEWFPNASGETPISAEVVTFQSGQVSRNTSASLQAFVVSTSPFLVGNDRGEEQRSSRSLVALVGQVPVKVVGKVQAGDVLVPSGKNDGRARVLRESDGLLPIIGTALTSTEEDPETVTVLVGVQPAIHPSFARLVQENLRLQNEVASIKKNMETVLTYIRSGQDSPAMPQKEIAE